MQPTPNFPWNDDCFPTNNPETQHPLLTYTREHEQSLEHELLEHERLEHR